MYEEDITLSFFVTAHLINCNLAVVVPSSITPVSQTVFSTSITNSFDSFTLDGINNDTACGTVGNYALPKVRELICPSSGGSPPAARRLFSGR